MIDEFSMRYRRDMNADGGVWEPIKAKLFSQKILISKVYFIFTLNLKSKLNLDSMVL